MYYSCIDVVNVIRSNVIKQTIIYQFIEQQRIDIYESDMIIKNIY